MNRDDVRSILAARNVDITTLDVDAIVNAANPTMRGGGGVDGAIHRAAGSELAIACEESYPHGCPTGMARITLGFDLPAKHVIHTVGPDTREYDFYLSGVLLWRCYQSCLTLADKHQLQSIAFPAISTGVYGFDIRRAASIAVNACTDHMIWNTHSKIKQITFACFGEEDTRIFADAI